VSTYLDRVVDALRTGTSAASGPADWSLAPEISADALPADARVLLVTPGFAESRHVVGLVLDPRGRVRAVLKVPGSLRDDQAVVHEAGVLRRLVEIAPSFQGTTPAVLACTTVGSRRVLLETPLEGEPLSHARVRSDPAARAGALAWVEALPTTGEADGGELLDELLEPRLDRLAALLPADHDLHATVAATREQVAPLRGRTLPVVFEHGDPAHPNILVLRGSAPVGLVDWELGLERGVVGHDLAQLLAFLAFAEAGVHGIAAEVPVFERELVAPDGEGRRLFADHVRGRVAPELEPALFVLAWARAALRILDRLTLVDKGDQAAVVAAVEASRNVALWRAAAAPRG